MRYVIILLLITSSAFAQETQFHERIAAVLDSGKYHSALEQLNSHFYDYPADFYAYKLRGIARNSINSPEEALTDFNIYLDHHPDDYEALFLRAVLRYRTGRYALAIPDFYLLINNNDFYSTSAIYFQHSSNSNSPTKAFTVQGNVNSIHYYYIGSSYFHMNKPLEAIPYYDTALFHNPDNADYLVARGLAYDNAGRYEQAILDFENALQASPDHGLAKYNLGNLLNRIGRSEEASYYLEQTIVEIPELAYPHAEMALRAYNNGNYEHALKAYNKAISLDPVNVDYIINRGKVKVRLEDYPGAMQDYNYAMQLKPDNEQIYFNMAVIEYKNGQYHEAVKLLDMAIFYYSEYALAYYNRAISQYELQNLNAACADIKSAASYNYPVDPEMMQAFCEH